MVVLASTFFFLAKANDLHVVEDTSTTVPDSQADNTLHSIKEVYAFAANNVANLTKEESQTAAISLDSSDLDVEIVQSTSTCGKTKNAYRPPAQAKQTNNQSTCSVTTSKKYQFTPFPTDRLQPQASGSGSQASSSTYHSKTPPKPLGSSSTVVPSTCNSPRDEWQIKHNTVTLGLVALRQLVAAMRLVKWRREMASRASPAELRNFSKLGLAILRMVKIDPANPAAPCQNIMAKTLNHPREQDNSKQKLEWVMAGWEPIKLAWDLMTNRRGIKGQFISSSTTGYTDLFRQ
jgi:hypothetical protein